MTTTPATTRTAHSSHETAHVNGIARLVGWITGVLELVDTAGKRTMTNDARRLSRLAKTAEAGISVGDRLRQRARGNGHRPIQDRGHPSARAMAQL